MRGASATSAAHCRSACGRSESHPVSTRPNIAAHAGTARWSGGQLMIPMETRATLTASGPSHRRQGESKKTANVIHAIVGTATSQKIDQTSLTRGGILPALDEAVTRATARSVLREPGSCQGRVAWEHARTNLQAARLQARAARPGRDPARAERPPRPQLPGDGNALCPPVARAPAFRRRSPRYRTDPAENHASDHNT